VKKILGMCLVAAMCAVATLSSVGCGDSKPTTKPAADSGKTVPGTGDKK
jgi:hypothetical protein